MMVRTDLRATAAAEVAFGLVGANAFGTPAPFSGAKASHAVGSIT
jgi:hypothetical protein